MKKIFSAVLVFFACVGCVFASDKSGAVEFEIAQKRFVDILDAPVVGKIIAVADSSGNLRWHTLSPFESLMIVNARGVFQFEKIGGAWRRLKTPQSDSLKTVVDGIRRLALGESSAGDYEITNVEKGKILVPKNSFIRRGVEKIVVINGAGRAPKSVEIFDVGGDRTLLEFVHVSENAQVSADAFDENAVPTSAAK